MITSNDLLKLAEMKGSPSISLYIPTHRVGNETLEGKDSLNLKNQLKEVRQQLMHQGMKVNVIDELIKPVSDLIKDGEFWRHQSDGLAVFLSHEFFGKFPVPLNFEETNYISDEFYLKPLMPLFNRDGQFYLLSLKMDEVKFYEGNKHSVTEINVKDLTPGRMEDVVGYDYQQKSFQFRTQEGKQRQGLFHGQGYNESKFANEMFVYFRAIDTGLMEILHDDQDPPFLVACLDHHFPVYKDANTYKNLFPENVSGNPADSDVFLLHEKAWKILEPHFNQTYEGKKKNYFENQNTEKTSTDLREVLFSCQQGKIDTLFIENNTDVFGTYNTDNGETEIQKEKTPSNVSLLNLSAIMTFKQGGKVYLNDKEEMPDSSSKVNALYRF